VLERNAWFGSCRPETRETLIAQGQLRLLHKGESLSRAGEPVDQLSLLIDGSLAISTTTRTGKRHVLRYLEPGQLMNLIPVLDEQPAIHDASAHVPTLVLSMHRTQVQAALQSEPELVRALMRLLCLRARLTYMGLAETALMPLTQRCAIALLHLAEPYGLPREEGLAISLKLSQDEFADMVGCSRPVANRELKQLESKGLIRTTYSHFVILDLQGLRAVAAG
jgi:CRP-like cAMP-binding protein